VSGKEFASAREDEGGDGGTPRTTGTLRIVVRDDDTIEYQVTVQNEQRRTFTGGHLYRGNPNAGGLEVATLFNGVSLSSRYIQLRGTGIIARHVDVTELMEDLRVHPADFVARIESRGASGASLLGALR
jgi:hypothetical protein